MDFCLASDERDYNEEVIFSDNIIALNDGTKLPINFDLNNPESSELYVLRYNNYNPYNNLISTNYYNPKKIDLTCLSSQTICDIGLTGTDNGLVTNMTGESITVTEGLLSNNDKFDRLSFDRRLKLHQVTGYTLSPNVKFSGLSGDMLFNVVSVQEDKVGIYHELYGGFYQGFYKLFGYEYEIFPTRVNRGWTVELLLKPRLKNKYTPAIGQNTLNDIYPQNKNTFFYFGTRAENKYYHHADGSPEELPGYNRVTSGLTTLETCACCNQTITNSRCIYVYPPKSNNDIHDPHLNYSCSSCGEKLQVTENKSYLPCKCGCDDPSYPNCGWECREHYCLTAITTTTTTLSGDCQSCDYCETCSKNGSIQSTCELDPLFDSMSNAISFKLCGDPKNPQIGIKILRFTGDCVTTGTCTTGITYVTGYTIQELCTPNSIYDICETKFPPFINNEHWVQLNFVWSRNYYLEECDLFYKGGLGLITRIEFLQSLANNSISLISPEISRGCESDEKIELVELNEKWLNEKDFRNGTLKIYVNGKLFHTFYNIEEIIPRGLNTDKEKQIGVPFNISWGGGTQGLHNHLIFTGIPESISGITYQQDPELFPENILSATTFSALSTNILIEQNFAGTFEGAISQFRMYTEPLMADEIKHNYLILKDKFDLLDYDCPNCETVVTTTTTTPIITPTPTPIVPQCFAYVVAEPQDSLNSLTNLGSYMYYQADGITPDVNVDWYGFDNSGSWADPNSENYSYILSKYISYSGFSQSIGNFVSPQLVKGAINQTNNIIFDKFGCPTAKHDFETIEINPNLFNTDIQYLYTIWIPTTCVGGPISNVTLEIGYNSTPCSFDTFAIPDPVISLKPITVQGNAAIPDGDYVVLYCSSTTLLPISLPSNNIIYFKGINIIN
jgi:hypothetical protein